MERHKLYLGLDLGTSGLRGILVTQTGQVVADAESVIATSIPQPGWSEQNPEDWINACQQVIGQIRSKNITTFSSLKGIGISGQMHGATLLNAEGHALRPCILWNDTRSAIEAENLDQIPEMRTISGNIVFPGFTAPKLEWIRNHQPEIFLQTTKVLLPKDYLRLWLTGEYISDMSDSAGTSWLDVGSRAWSEEALSLSHMRRDQMPELVEGSEPGGELRKSLRQEWGISGPVLIAGGAGDNAATACGIGSVKEGSGFLSLGTSGVLLVTRETFAPAPETAVHSFCHAVPNRWIQMGVILSATNSLNWLSKNLGQSISTLTSNLPNNLKAPSAVKFLPYLSGERTPHNDSNIRGAFLGLDIGSETSDLTQAVMEGVTYAMRDCLEALNATGNKPESLVVVGGGSQSNYWLKTLATVLNTPLQIPKGSEFAAAVGAARLAMCACGIANLTDLLDTPNIDEVIEPTNELVDSYETEYRRFSDCYLALAPLAIK